MRIAAVTPDLMTFSRIEAAATAAGHVVHRADAPFDLPPAIAVDLVLVDWGARGDSWGRDLQTWKAEGSDALPRIIAFGPHTDLVAHAAAREVSLAPVWARSRLFSSLPGLFRPPTDVAADTASAACEE